MIELHSIRMHLICQISQVDKNALDNINEGQQKRRIFNVKVPRFFNLPQFSLEAYELLSRDV